MRWVGRTKVCSWFPKNFTSQAAFLRKALKDVLYKTEAVSQERGGKEKNMTLHREDR